MDDAISRPHNIMLNFFDSEEQQLELLMKLTGKSREVLLAQLGLGSQTEHTRELTQPQQA
ncbi:hypothetical protein D5085_15095 [Ectothiorhodospiraceae bacterium BW-2]|nr:hypothetical protein D5085_15095 [Ectothiorhodospiraceae bacterium BW-2]